jgi:Peptidase C13 family
LTPFAKDGGYWHRILALGANMRKWLNIAVSTLLLSSCPASAQSLENIAAAEEGFAKEQARDAKWLLDQHERLSAAIAAVKPQTPGVIDAFVVVAGLDSDAVFIKESTEAAKVLAHRYNAEGHTILLATGAEKTAPQGSPSNLAIALSAMAAKMDLKEDVLVLYTTSHGNPKIGIVYRDGEKGFGMIAPQRLEGLLDSLGIKRRLLMISACYSGIFVPVLKNEDSIIITAASDKRSSFGCSPGNDWTFFGDALINNALRTPEPLEKSVKDAFKLVETWETTLGLVSSDPQVSFGKKSDDWLLALEKQMPTDVTAKVGKPAIESDDLPKPH